MNRGELNQPVNPVKGSRGPQNINHLFTAIQFFILQCHKNAVKKDDTVNFLLTPSLCDHDNSPVNFRSCVMPRDCKVSDWSQWSPCSKTCRTSDQSPGFRIRSRSLERAVIGGGEPCPALEEKANCNVLEDTLPLCPRWRDSIARIVHPNIFKCCSS